MEKNGETEMRKEEVKDRLRQAREAMMLTQTEIAEKLNTSRGNYAAYESGLRNMSDKTMRKYSEILNIDPLWLKYGDNTLLSFIDSEKNDKLLENKDWGGREEEREVKKNLNLKDKLISAIDDLNSTELAIFVDVMRKITNNID